MATRFWLNEKAEQALTDQAGEHHKIAKLNGTSVSLDKETGRYYYHSSADPAGTGPAPNPFGGKFVHMVTYSGTISENLRADGTYRHKGAVATLDTKNDVSMSSSGEIIAKHYQKVSISARSYRTICELYNLIRSGQIVPEVYWEARQLTAVESREADHIRLSFEATRSRISELIHGELAVGMPYVSKRHVRAKLQRVLGLMRQER